MSTVENKSRVSGSLGRCMHPLLDSLGWKGEKRTFLNALPFDYREFNVQDMMNTMANLGFMVNCSKGTLQTLDHRLFPCLCVTRENKPYVLFSFEKNGFFCFDGELSVFNTLHIDTQANTFYFFEDMAKSAANPEKPQKDWFVKFVARFRKQIFLTLMLSMFLTFTALMSPLIVMGIYKQINTAESLTGFWVIGTGIVGMLLIDLMFRIFRHRIVTYLGARMGFLVSTQVFKRILLFSPSATENASVGSQIVRMRDFNSVKSFIEGSGMISVMELPFFIILFVGLVLMGGGLAYIPIAALFLLLMFSVFIMPFIKRTNADSAVSGSRKQEFLIEFFSEFRSIKMSGLTAKWRKTFESVSADAAMDNFRMANLNVFINNVAQATVSIAGTVTIGVGVLGVLNGTISGAVLIAAMMLVWKILSPITSGFSVFSQSVRIKKSLLQLNRLMSMQYETIDNDMASAAFQGRIVFKGVSLRYKPDYYPALLGVECTIDKGGLTVITGHEGAGKSTFLKLIMGMYKAQAGGITIDGTNIQQLAPSLLRRSIVYLPQEDTLFSGSIEQNLKYYSPASSDEDVQRVLHVMGLGEEINKMPDNLNTQVSMLKSYCKDYVSFSRRLCFARTFLNKSNIILLDEPDRGLTSKQLKALVVYLNSMKSEKTIIIASNNPIMLEKAGTVITFNMGSIANIEQPENA